jgi:DNA adenine methylase
MVCVVDFSPQSGCAPRAVTSGGWRAPSPVRYQLAGVPVHNELRVTPESGPANRESPAADRSSGSPLLKWVGGKRQLLPALRRFYPVTFRRYIEPFVGSGAVFFDLCAAGRLEGNGVILIDSNADLIGCYETVRARPEEVGAALEALAAGHARQGSAHYYMVRDERFNPLREALRQSSRRIAYTPELAAMLIYLNRTGFNGLYRVNTQGWFNVSAGRYERPRIADRKRLRGVADAFERSAARLECGSFRQALDVAASGDFLYIDPPYAPLSATANFTSYTAPRFDQTDQDELQRAVIALARRGCHVLVSNSTARSIADLYDGNSDARAAGLRTYKVSARRAVNRVASRRGPVDEYLITNIAETRGLEERATHSSP